jgi:tetratricopeptide (TPR) repeat protein
VAVVLAVSLWSAIVFADKVAERTEELKKEGNAAWNKKDYAAAIAVASELIKLNTEYDKGYRMRAMAQIALGRYDEAIPDLSEWIRRHPECGPP